MDDDCRVDKEWTKKWQKVIQSKVSSLVTLQLFHRDISMRF